MQAHGQEEKFMGHNQVEWSSKPGKLVVWLWLLLHTPAQD